MKQKKLLAQNSKLKKDGIWQFDIPAYKSRTGLITCPMAKDCIANCYARQGTYQFSTVREKHEWNLEQTLKDEFSKMMIDEIKSKRNCKIVRIQSAGDYYSREYIQKWFKVMDACQDVLFYSYTKSFTLFNGMTLPKNFRLIQSFGGKSEVDYNKPHAIVVNSVDDIPQGYADASYSDLVAINNDKIALVFHGTKKAVNNGFIKGM